MDHLSHLFRNAHAMAKQGRPYQDYEWMCDLDEKKGINIGKTYRNRKEAAVFAESTDSSVQETKIVFVRYSSKGTVFTSFVGVKHVGKANADNITEAILLLLRDTFGTEWENKTFGVATDGASVMTGKKGGNYLNRIGLNMLSIMFF